MAALRAAKSGASSVRKVASFLLREAETFLAEGTASRHGEKELSTILQRFLTAPLIHCRFDRT